MKTYSIGRELNCDIVINDSTDVISRRHALLNVSPSGKMTIIDQSSNGTYVNGIRISQNVPVPVTRKDIISLAHVAKLDWNQVPKSNQLFKYIIAAIVAIIVIVGLIFGVKGFNSGNDAGNGIPLQTEINDSTLIKQREAARQDSIKNVARQDSIKRAEEKARQDSIESKNKAEQERKKKNAPSKSETDKNINDQEKQSGQSKVKKELG